MVLGITVSACIHGHMPEGYLTDIMDEQSWWSVPVAVVIGIPMYTNAAGVIPILDALLAKGAALGTALAFMISVIALFFPEMVILRKVLKPRLIATFIDVVGTGILFVGYLFNIGRLTLNSTTTSAPGETTGASTQFKENSMKLIQILGLGCPRCNELESLVYAVLAENGLEAHVEKVKDMQTMATLGVFTTPALVIDGEVKSAGRSPSKEEITKWIK